MSCRPQKACDDLASAAERQGFRVKRTRNGVMIYAKDKALGIVTLHKTPSDSRAINNSRSELRRIGVEV